MRVYITVLLLGAWLTLGGSTLHADDFTRFRGADATGVAKNHPALPDSWSKTDNVAWVADIPGQGWGSPIVVGDRMFVSSVVADEENIKPQGGLYLGEGVRDPAKGIHHWMVYCFDMKSGKELWHHEAHTGRPTVPRHPKSSYAAETPTTDGKRVFVLFGDLGLYCYSLDGDHLWSKPIEPKKTNMDYGAAASPVVHDGRVFVVYDNKEESWIAAFDAETGKERWRTKRDETMSWATPFVWENELRTEIIVSGQRVNRSYSLDGEELWRFDGDMSVLVIPSPFAAHGTCYISSGYVGDSHRPTFAIRPGAKGKLATEDGFKNCEFIEWYQPKASPYNTTQIVYGDYLYTVYDQGFMTCHNALTGEEIYGKRRFSPKGSFTASPWAYDGKVFCLSEDGLTYVIKAGQEFEILQTNPLDELCIATPSVAGGKLLVRTLTKVYCITRAEGKLQQQSNRHGRGGRQEKNPAEHQSPRKRVSSISQPRVSAVLRCVVESAMFPRSFSPARQQDSIAHRIGHAGLLSLHTNDRLEFARTPRRRWLRPTALPAVSADPCRLEQSRTATADRLPRNTNLNAHLERFFGSPNSECLHRLILFGDSATRKAVRTYVAHYHTERNHQGLGNELIEPLEHSPDLEREIETTERLGGLLRSYRRDA